MYPTMQIDKQLKHFQDKEPLVYSYIRCLHNLLNGYFQAMRLVSTGIIQENRFYNSLSFYKVMLKVCKVASSVPVVGKMLELVGSTIGAVLKYRSDRKWKQTLSKIEQLIQPFLG